MVGPAKECDAPSVNALSDGKAYSSGQKTNKEISNIMDFMILIPYPFYSFKSSYGCMVIRNSRHSVASLLEIYQENIDLSLNTCMYRLYLLIMVF